MFIDNYSVSSACQIARSARREIARHFELARDVRATLRASARLGYPILMTLKFLFVSNFLYFGA